MENELMSLPMVALRGLAVLPEQVTHFDVSREKSVQGLYVKKSKACKRTRHDDRRDKIAARHGRYNCCQSSNGL